jgi:hypothetical protein
MIRFKELINWLRAGFRNGDSGSSGWGKKEFSCLANVDLQSSSIRMSLLKSCLWSFYIFARVVRCSLTSEL